MIGIHGAIARALLRRLEDDERYTRLVLIDVRAPSKPVRRSVFYQVDLTEPLADTILADVLRREQVETAVHLALREAPIPLADSAHEIETVGTMVLLNTVADCIARQTSLRARVTVSTAMVYGAHPLDPAYLAEGHPLRGAAHVGFVADKVDVELQLEEFRRQFQLPICVLRPCWTALGGSSIGSRLLGPPFFTVLGFDPLMQLLHDGDLLDIVMRAVDSPRDGAFNVAGPGALPVSALLRIVGRGSVALPAPIAYPATELLWRSYGVGSGIPLDFVRYVWTVDGDATSEAFGVSPRYSTREVAEGVARAL